MHFEMMHNWIYFLIDMINMLKLGHHCRKYYGRFSDFLPQRKWDNSRNIQNIQKRLAQNNFLLFSESDL